ncbi:hypothetical protein A5791_15890 [Mycobacterium sp. 852002-51163_SCH5372311]|uniref:DUF732 domain-containing protein n=1 Tax=Mycobacterium sp. 852002-51163_SCH5372311 TaxID=1834097 RepID=UPI0007FF5C43|nr:DUF732 domain-containing protein [Mycobacterium sp. 852002-51163_SCH5372311]OBF91057.1 hypothetical protein A5791_15890 [Mycobacterium sp. 852002-51163_SCH5372311]
MSSISRKAVATVGGLVAAGIVGAAGLAPSAHAATGEVAYLQALNQHGFTIYDTATAIQTGHTICTRLNYENGDDTARWLYLNTPSSNIPTIASAQMWVMDAVFTLCPWQYHPYSSV